MSTCSVPSMAKMTLAQARKMRDGVLKGDSAIAQAWKELISGEAASEPATEAEADAEERGYATLERFKARDEGW